MNKHIFSVICIMLGASNTTFAMDEQYNLGYIVKLQQKVLTIAQAEPACLVIQIKPGYLYCTGQQFKTALFESLSSVNENDDLKKLNIEPLLTYFNSPSFLCAVASSSNIQDEILEKNQPVEAEAPTLKESNSSWQKKLFYPVAATTLLTGVGLGYMLAKQSTQP